MARGRGCRRSRRTPALEEFKRQVELNSEKVCGDEGAGERLPLGGGVQVSVGAACLPAQKALPGWPTVSGSGLQVRGWGGHPTCRAPEGRGQLLLAETRALEEG